MPMPIMRLLQFSSHRPGAADGEAGVDHGVEEGLPAGAGGAVRAVALGLLEGVVDGDRKGRVRLLGEAVHRLRHAVEEEGLGLLLAAVAVGRGDQFLGLGYGERGEEVGEDGLQRAAQPDVEEVRQVGVADVVVVGWVGGDDLVDADSSALLRLPVAHDQWPMPAMLVNALRDSCRLADPKLPPMLAERICFREIPSHRNRLPTETCSRRLVSMLRPS